MIFTASFLRFVRKRFNEILDKDQDGSTMKLKADIRRIADEIIEEL